LIFKDDGLGAAAQCTDDPGLLKGCGEDDDLGVRYRSNITDQLNPVSIGQLRVQDHHRGSMSLYRPHCRVGASACRHDHKIGILFEKLAQRRQHLALIVDKNYPRSPARSIWRPSSETHPTITGRPRDAFFAPDCITP
jgi:hypothetical protein